MSEKYVTVSVIVPSRNRDMCLSRTLSDLGRQTFKRCEIVVVDQSDAPSVKARATLSSLEVPTRYIKDEGRGAARARNLGASHSSGDILVFLDDDVEIDDASFIAHHARSYDDPEIGAVCGRVIEAGAENDSAAIGPPRVLLPFCLVYGSGNWVSAAFVNNVKGGNMSVRAQLLRAVGGFSEDFGQPCLYEETDVALKICAAGAKIVFRPECALRHLGALSGGQRAESRAPETRFLAYRDRVLLFRNHCSWWTFPAFVLANLMLACRPLLQLNARSSYTAMRGLLDGCSRYLSYPWCK